MSMSSYEYFRCLRWYCTIGRYGLVDDKYEKFIYEQVKDLVDKIEMNYIDLAGKILIAPGLKFIADDLGFSIEEAFRLLLWAQIPSRIIKNELMLEEDFNNFYKDRRLYNYKTIEDVKNKLKEIIARND